MLTPFNEQEQQRQQQQQLNQHEPNEIDYNVEELLFNYLQIQQPPPDPEPVKSIIPVDFLSPELYGLPLSTFSAASTPSTSYNSMTSNSSFDSSNNLFQSPQLPFLNQLRRQSDSSTGHLDFSISTPLLASTNDLQQQQNTLPMGESWGDPLLDMLQATISSNNNNNGSYHNDNETTMDHSSAMDTTTNDNNRSKSNIDTKNIRLEVNSYTDLQNLLESMKNQVGAHFLNDDHHTMQHHRRKRRKNRQNNLTDLEQQQKQQYQQQQEERRRAAAKAASMNILPAAVRDTVDTAFFLPLLMEKAEKHWCCVGFKVAPVTLDMIRNWRQTPITIIYSLAAIVLVTIMDHNAGQVYAKTAAMVFYEQARRKLDDVVFDDEDDISNYYLEGYDGDGDDTTVGNRKKAMTIQSYFCLSYTSNLLRLYDQQQTWGCLASIALQLRTKDAETGCRPMDQAILLCYCRWYYVDAWMALTLQRECLLSETPPQFILDIIQRETASTTSTSSTSQYTSPYTTLPHEHQTLYHFAVLGKFMRRFIRVLRWNKLMDPVTLKPSAYYYAITNELQQWYHAIQQQQKTTSATTTMIGPISLDSNNNNMGGCGLNTDQPGSGIHLHLCYNAMRLVIIYKFLHPGTMSPDDPIIVDALETNLTILQSLQQLVLQGCDQSTYHTMYFAIHNTASRIHQYYTKNRSSKCQRWARQQLQMNLVLLKGTQAYVNDVFQMREHAEKIEEQFKHMGLVLSPYYRSTLDSMEKQQQLLLQQQQTLEKNWMDVLMMDSATNNSTVSSSSSSYNAFPKSPPATTAAEAASEATSAAEAAEAASAAAAADTSTSNSSCATLPGIHVYKLHTASTIKKPRNSNKNKKIKKSSTTSSHSS